MELIRRFEKISKSDVGLAGGKGASLGEMTQAGIPVPPGFVILSDSFERFIHETKLVAEIEGILDKVDHNEIHTVEEASEEIKALIMQAKMPDDISGEIVKEFNKLGAKFVAVRSSATSEDSASAAWAGQLDSYLNTTSETLLENVKRCWASLFTPRAIFYRFEKGLDKVKVSVAVVVQKMVASEESGIAFSVHPVTQDYNQLIIEAGFGLGEAIVSGQITPDSYVVTKDKLEIIENNVSEQTRGLYRKSEGGGNEWKDIPIEEGGKQVLSNSEIVELAGLIIKIENHYKFPVDVEWAREGKKFYIVQSRPITTLSKIEEEKEDFAKYKWKVFARDFNSPFIRNYIWVKSFFSQAKEFGITRGIFGISSKKDEIEYIAEMESAIKLHEGIKEKIEKDMFFVEKTIDKTNELGEEFNKWTYTHLYNEKLNKLTNQEIIELLKKFDEKQGRLYSYGTLIALLDLQNFSFVEGNLKKFLKEKLNEKDFIKYYEILTQPIHNSFSQEQEEDLLKLMKEFFDKKFIEDVKNKKLDEVKKIYPKFYEALKKHAEKHGWVYYVYKGPAFNEDNFFEFVKDNLNRTINPSEKLKEIQEKKKETEKLRREYIKNLHPDKFNEMILNLAGKIVWGKPRRKDYQSKSYYHFEKLLSEIAGRLDITLEQVRSCPFELIEEGLNKGKIDVEICNSIHNFHVCLPGKEEDEEVVVLHGKEAEKFYNEHVSKGETSEKNENIESIKGQTANPGKARGRVKIINKPEDMGKMNHGDVLVSIATTPSIVPAMKKASAIVTDEGGLTCHASIVSRELGITCIVGTKIATQILKDGDLVEVDADKGVVRILERGKENKTKWVKQLSRENTLLDRSLRCIAYAKSVEEIGKAKIRSPIIGMGKVTSLYYDPVDYKEQQKIIMSEIKGEGMKRLGNGIVNYLEEGYKWAKKYKGKKLSRKEFIEYFKQFNIHHAHSRGAITYSYWGSPVIEDKLKESLRKKVDASELDMTMSMLSVPKQIKGELNQLHHSSDELWKKHEHLIKELKLNKEDSELVEVLSWFTYLYEMGERVSSYLFDEFLNHLKEQVNDKEFEELQWYDPTSLYDYLNGKKLSDYEIENRKKMFILQIINGKLYVLSGEEALQKYKNEFEEKLPNDSHFLKGTTASPGKIKGRVKIVITRDDQSKMNKGDILVSTMTTPRLMEAVKLAAAIITDEGGLTAHAAIVAREFKIPCIVGTKIATQILKDGDLVEVDADKGVVRILERAGEKPAELKKNEDEIIFEKSISRDWPLFIIEMLHEGFTKEYKKQLGFSYSDVLFDIHPDNLDIYRAPIEHIDRMREFILGNLEKNPEFIKDCSKTLLKYFKEFLDVIKKIDNTNLRSISNNKLSRIIKDFIKAHMELEPTFVINFWFPIQMENHPLSKKWKKEIEVAINTRVKTEKVGPEGDRIARKLSEEVSRRMFGDETLAKFISLKETEDFLVGNKKIKRNEVEKRRGGFVYGSLGIEYISLEDYAELLNYKIKSLDVENKNLPKIEKVLTRDLPLTNIYAWHLGYTSGLKKCMGWSYSDTLFYFHDGSSDTMRPEEEHKIQFKNEFLKKYNKDNNWFSKLCKDYDKLLRDIQKFYKQNEKINNLTDKQIAKAYLNYVDFIETVMGPFVIMYWIPQWFETDNEKKRYKDVIETAMKYRKETEWVFPDGDKLILSILEKINKKLNLNRQELKLISKDELLEYLNDGGKPEINTLKEREKGFIYSKKGITFIESKEIKDILLEHGFSYESNTNNNNINELKGEIAYRGKVKGRVQKILQKDKIKDFIEGNILVASMTTPEYLPAMKKALAFVTDEGGVTCHAAIVARELKKPCIIGTKIATQVLRDGDLIEVDADNGIVRILNRDENKESKYTFLWSDFQPHITVQNNIESVTKYPKNDWNDINNVIEVSRNNRIYCYHSKKDLQKDRERGKLLFDKKYSDRIFNEIEKYSKEYYQMFEELKKINYSKLSNKELYNIFKRVQDNWSHIIGYFRFSQAEGTYYLAEELKKQVSAEEVSILMLPVKLDAINLELMDWQKLIKKPYSDKLILEHAFKYPWLVMSHFRYEDVIETLKQKYDYDKIHFKEKDIAKEKKELKEKQKKILKNNPKIRELVELLQNIGFSRIKVKSCWAGTDFYSIPLYEEIAKRGKENLNDLWLYYLNEEIKELLENNKKLSDIERKARDNCFVGLLKDGKVNYYSGDEAEKVAERELGSLYKIKENSEIKGVSAYPGKVKGKARILGANNVAQTRNLRKDFKRGEILVTQMTQPNVIDIASKANAIVTDEGGMLSHAAIISRELKVPCIVGTHFATEIIKDGDLVEVDADNGIVKMLERLEGSINDESKNKLEFVQMWEAHSMGTFGGESVVAFNVTRDPKLKERFGIVEDNCLFYYEKGKGTQFFYEKKELEKAGEYGFKRFTDSEKTQEYIDDCNLAIKNSDKYYNEFLKENWKKMSVKDIFKLFKEQLRIVQHSYGIFYACQPQYFEKIERYILDELKKKLDNNTANDVFSTLTLPDELDLLGKEELEWLNIVKEIKGRHKKNEFSIDKLTQRDKGLIKKHSDKYIFLGSVESKHPWTYGYYLGLLKEQYFSDIDTKIEEINEKKKILINKKKDLINRYNLDNKVIEICQNICKLGYIRLALRFAWTKDIYVYIKYKEEICKKKQIPTTEEYKLKEYENLIEKDIKLSDGELQNRKKAFLFITKDFINESPYDNIEFYSGDEAIKKKQELVNNENLNLNELKGNVACKGKVTGRVFKFTWVEEDLVKKMSEMNKGDILVAGQTRPFLMPAIRKAGAIVADEGGIAGHASIVSRELNIPCVIGTKIATKVLNTGDLVEVDADNGIVRILERAK